MDQLTKLNELVKKKGVIKALKSFDIESIKDDETIKIVCRTILFSNDRLIELLEDRIEEKIKLNNM